jgi:hypothetical protein
MTDVLATLGGVPWTQQARQGYFDGARVCLERAFTATWGDWSAGTLIRFWGRVGQRLAHAQHDRARPVSDLVLMQRPMPRNVYQPGCLHNLFDAGCTLNRASFAVAGAVGGGSTASSINTNLTQATGYFELGAITFTSGVNNGLVRTVKTFTHAGGVVVPTATLPAAPANGDTFSIVPGCDKTPIHVHARSLRTSPTSGATRTSRRPRRRHEETRREDRPGARQRDRRSPLVAGHALSSWGPPQGRGRRLRAVPDRVLRRPRDRRAVRPRLLLGRLVPPRRRARAQFRGGSSATCVATDEPIAGRHPALPLRPRGIARRDLSRRRPRHSRVPRPRRDRGRVRAGNAPRRASLERVVSRRAGR